MSCKCWGLVLYENILQNIYDICMICWFCYWVLLLYYTDGCVKCCFWGWSFEPSSESDTFCESRCCVPFNWSRTSYKVSFNFFFTDSTFLFLCCLECIFPSGVRFKGKKISWVLPFDHFSWYFALSRVFLHVLAINQLNRSVKWYFRMHIMMSSKLQASVKSCNQHLVYWFYRCALQVIEYVVVVWDVFLLNVTRWF